MFTIIKKMKPKELEQAHKAIEDLRNPPEVDWRLSDDDKKVITCMVQFFLSRNRIVYHALVCSKDFYPELWRFYEALHGRCQWQESLAAYDYLEKEWPEIAPLLADTEENNARTIR
jgi:hypothetical protein